MTRPIGNPARIPVITLGCRYQTSGDAAFGYHARRAPSDHAPCQAASRLLNSCSTAAAIWNRRASPMVSPISISPTGALPG